MAGKRGLEPPTTRLTAESSAIELLAIELLAIMAGRRELESLTSAVTVRCSNQTELTSHNGGE